MTTATENVSATLARRYLECAAFVLLWVAAGFYFKLGLIAFQLLGLPLMVAFQLTVARRPLAQLWAQDADSFRLDRRTWVIAGGLFFVCAALFFARRGRVAATTDVQMQFAGLLLASILPAAFALRRQSAAALRRALGPLAIAVLFRVGWQVAWAPTWGGETVFPVSKLPDFLTDFCYEFVALFLVDEVAFRGVLDPHLASAGGGRLHAWCSAVFASILWSVWHFPAYHPKAKTFVELFTLVEMKDLLPVIFGVPLAFCARRARTLAPTSAIHAAGNAYVLTLMK